jgi:RNA polymerase sigma-70 factor (ECF subfamily)
VIDTLPDNQKTAFILSFVEDLKRQEVADIMEMSLKAVESLLQRAKASLREKLEKMYPDRRKKG